MAAAGCGRGRRAAARAGTLRYVMPIEPATLDPALLTEGDTIELLQNVYEGLTAFDKDNRVVPVLAKSWDVSPDGRTYTFRLRGGVRFHNGRPLVAADVKHSWERSLWPETRSTSAATYLDGILGLKEVVEGRARQLQGVQAVDESVLRVRLDRARGFFVQSIAYPSCWVVCREALEASGRVDQRAAVGTETIRLAEYHHGSRVVLEANPDYHGGRPRLDRIQRPVVTDRQTPHVLYENGEVDICRATVPDFLRDQRDPAMKEHLHLAPQAEVSYLCMHPRLEPVFRKPDVRQAFARALDKEEIVRVATHGLWTTAAGLLPPGLPGHNPGLAPPARDPRAARELLARAGHPGGRGFPRLTLVYPQNESEIGAAAQVIRSQLQEVLGITLDLQEREGATFVSDRRAEKMPLYIGTWGADYLDPQNFLSTLLRSGVPLNDFGYSNPRFDALVDRADSEPDMATRIPLYQEADRIAMQDVAVLTLFYRATPLLVKPFVKDWEINLIRILPHLRTRIDTGAR